MRESVIYWKRSLRAVGGARPRGRGLEVWRGRRDSLAEARDSPRGAIGFVCCLSSSSSSASALCPSEHDRVVDRKTADP